MNLSLQNRTSLTGRACHSITRAPQCRLAGRGIIARTAAKPSVEELAEIDPITGQPISTAALTSPVAGARVQAGRRCWAYREAAADPALAAPDKPHVLLLHGLASSSYCYRNTLGLLGAAGYRAIAPDWPGHGDSDKPGPDSGFAYREGDYVGALAEFVQAVGVRQPFALVVQGFVLGQYGLQYALQHPEQVSRLLVLNTPLARSARLRPELAAYKAPLPFMRPGNKPFDFMTYNMSGSPYAMAERDALAYGRASQDPAATAAVAKTMEQLDFPQLLREVDEGFRTWRKPTVCLFGAADPFLQVGGVEDWLESKRTNIKCLTMAAKLGHMPQEDYPEALHEMLLPWLAGATDAADFRQGALRMTRYGVVEGRT